MNNRLNVRSGQMFTIIVDTVNSFLDYILNATL